MKCDRRKQIAQSCYVLFLYVYLLFFIIQGGHMRRYVMFFVFALFLELTLFNYKFLLTCPNKPYIPEFTVGDGLQAIGNGEYLVLPDGDYTITAICPKEEIRALRLDIGYAGRVLGVGQDGAVKPSSIVKEYEKKKIYIQIEAQDKSNQLGFMAGRRDIVHEVQQTTYMLFHLNGPSEWMKFRLTLQPGEVIQVYAIEFQPQIPFYFSLVRFLCVGGLLSILYLLRPNSFIYQYSCKKSPVKEFVVWGFILAEILLFSRLVVMNPYFVYPTWSHHNQYYELAEAFDKGQFYLTEEPPQFLKEMENPYDTGLRSSKINETGESILWDHAYYNGKYYVYFGVVPELLFYYPYYKCMGTIDEEGEFHGGRLDHFKIIFFCAALEVMAVYLLLREIVRLWFKKTPFILYLFLSVALSMGSGVLTILLRPDFYSVPIISGIMFSLWGLYFWLSAKKAGQRVLWRMAVGSLCMALVAGCRPQMLVMSVFIFPLFWEITDKKAGKRKYLEMVCLLLPYCIVAIGLMYYNMARFGSPFDFGANYNLTTNDMTGRGIELGRTGLGLFSYLFQPANYEAVFPFLTRSNYATTYLGKTISEGTFGGVFAVHLFLVPLLFLPWLKKYYSKKCCYQMSVLSFLAAIIVVVADTQMAGILARYFSDFSFMLYIAECFLLLSLYEYVLLNGKGLPMRLYRFFLMAVCLSGTIYHVLRIYTGSASTLVMGNPVEFYKAAHLMAFWR